MYFVEDGVGRFGQHAWNEVYLGQEVGWVALDTTLRERDYVDAGHVRLGMDCSFQPIELEILDYELAMDAALSPAP